MAKPEYRNYHRQEVACFRKTADNFGGLSNMAPGFPIKILGHHIRTSEALYQACRFPHMPDIQHIILNETSPMTAKMRTKPYRKDSRYDWDDVKVPIMKWCLRIKLINNWEKFSALLLSTGQRPIVEDSRKDDYWGAKPNGDNILEGQNVLGRLLMELREKLRVSPEQLKVVHVPPISQFLLLGEPLQAESLSLGGYAPIRAANTDEVRTFSEAHSELLQFAIGHLLPTFNLQRELQAAVLTTIAKNLEIGTLASAGILHEPQNFDLLEGRNTLEDRLGGSPPEHVTFGDMVASVEKMELGYKHFCDRIVKVAERSGGATSPQEVAPDHWERWRISHNRMIEAYEGIKRDPRMGKLYRPVRPSRWGAKIEPPAAPPDDWVPYPVAVQQALDEIDQTPIGRWARQNCPPDILPYYAEILFGEDVDLEGARPPSTRREKIRRADKGFFHFSDDLTAIHYHDADSPHYVDIHIRRSDLKRQIEIIKCIDPNSKPH